MINQSFVFDGIVYYGNTTIGVSLNRKRFLRKPKTRFVSSFRLLNCIYKPWMVERQTKLGDTYRALTEETKFTPQLSLLSKETCIAYTLPFQEIALPCVDSEGKTVGTLNLLSLFIPYSLRKSYLERPPLMHMAAVIGDIPLLKRAVDVENRGEIWDFNVRISWLYHVEHESTRDCSSLSPEASIRVPRAASRTTHI